MLPHQTDLAGYPLPLLAAGVVAAVVLVTLVVVLAARLLEGRGGQEQDGTTSTLTGRWSESAES